MCVLELFLQCVRYFLRSIQFLLLYRGSESTNTIYSLSLVPLVSPFSNIHTHFFPYSSCLSNSTFSTSPTVLFYLLNLCGLCLSGYQDMEKTGSLSARMKGGGGIGITGGGRGEGESQTAPSRPYPPGIHPGGKTLLSMCVC